MQKLCDQSPAIPVESPGSFAMSLLLNLSWKRVLVKVAAQSWVGIQLTRMSEVLGVDRLLK